MRLLIFKQTTSNRQITPRIIAIRSIEQWRKTDAFIEELLGNFFNDEKTSHFTELDRHFAYEIALGTVRNWQAIIWYITHELQVKLPKGHIKQACLAVAIYQRLFHQSIQETPYALVFEYVEVAKQLVGIHDPFYKFLNALLRKALNIPSKILTNTPSVIEVERSPQHAKTFFSIPDNLFQLLHNSYSNAETIYQILLSTIKPIPNFLRGLFDYQSGTFIKEKITDTTALKQTTCTIHTDTINYIQNITQPTLIETILQAMDAKKKLVDVKGKLRVVDLCAAPGGKSIMCWQVLEPAVFIVNEPSIKRQKKLKENLDRFGVKATITSFDGTKFPLSPREELFDIAIIDAPCSNTGVLYKCPEAKYRLTSDTLKDHVSLQRALLAHASSLIRKGGYIWYSTCSILKEENREQIAWSQETLSLDVVQVTSIIPDGINYEGGFGALLIKK